MTMIPGLKGDGDESTVHDRPGRGAQLASVWLTQPALAIERRAQRVDDSADQPVAHRHVHDPARPLDLIARV